MITVKYKQQREAQRRVKQLSFRREVGDRILTSRGIEIVVSKDNKLYPSISTLHRTTTTDDSTKQISLIKYDFNVGGIFCYKIKEIYSFGTEEYTQADKQLKTPWEAN